MGEYLLRNQEGDPPAYFMNVVGSQTDNIQVLLPRTLLRTPEEVC